MCSRERASALRPRSCLGVVLLLWLSACVQGTWRTGLYRASTPRLARDHAAVYQKRNWCPHTVSKTVTCQVQNGTVLQRVYQSCVWPQGCSGASYKTLVRPSYRLVYRTVTSLEWRCCPGFSGAACEEEGANQLVGQEAARRPSSLRPPPPPRTGETASCLNCSRITALSNRLGSLEAKVKLLTAPKTERPLQGKGVTAPEASLLTGAVPAQGAPGEPGPAGPQGDSGRDGAQGRDGRSGLRGPLGPSGPSGPKGDAGVRGPSGTPGGRGSSGPVGPRGPPGNPGMGGLPGPPGTPGLPGTPAPASARIPEPDLRHGKDPYFTNTFQEPQGTPIPGPQGPPGPVGPVGPVGSVGPVGPAGQSGQNGRPGAIGVAGPVGPKGDRGERGPLGYPGERGIRGDSGAVGPKGEPGAKGLPGDGIHQIREALKILAERVLILETMIGIHEPEPGSGDGPFGAGSSSFYRNKRAPRFGLTEAPLFPDSEVRGK